MAIIPGAEALDWTPIISKIIYWIGWGLASVGILTAMFFGYYLSNFKIKAMIIPLHGSSKDGIFAVGKPKYNKVKWINQKSAWKSMKPFFNKKEREPFDDEYIYPGNRIYAFELNDEWLPGRINITKSEDTIRSEIALIPHRVREWVALQLKKNEIEYAKSGWWEENKQLMITLGVVFLCLCLCGATVYFTYKFAGVGTSAMGNLANAIKNFNVVPGTPPG